MLTGKLPDNITEFVRESKNHQVINSYKTIFGEISGVKKSQTSFFEKDVDYIIRGNSKWDLKDYQGAIEDFTGYTGSC